MLTFESENDFVTFHGDGTTYFVRRATYGIYGDSVDRFQWIMTYGLRGV